MNLVFIIGILIGGNEQKRINANTTQEPHRTCALLTGPVSSKWRWKIFRRAQPRPQDHSARFKIAHRMTLERAGMARDQNLQDFGDFYHVTYTDIPKFLLST